MGETVGMIFVLFKPTLVCIRRWIFGFTTKQNTRKSNRNTQLTPESTVFPDLSSVFFSFYNFVFSRRKQRNENEPNKRKEKRKRAETMATDESMCKMSSAQKKIRYVELRVSAQQELTKDLDLATR